MRLEASTYIESSSESTSDVNLRLFWTKSKVASWAAAARKVLLLVPSSATCERVFSIMSNLFDDRRLGAKEDLIETTLLLRVNQIARARKPLLLEVAAEEEDVDAASEPEDVD